MLLALDSLPRGRRSRHSRALALVNLYFTSLSAGEGAADAWRPIEVGATRTCRLSARCFSYPSSRGVREGQRRCPASLAAGACCSARPVVPPTISHTSLRAGGSEDCTRRSALVWGGVRHGRASAPLASTGISRASRRVHLWKLAVTRRPFGAGAVRAASPIGRPLPLVGWQARRVGSRPRAIRSRCGPGIMDRPR